MFTTYRTSGDTQQEGEILPGETQQEGVKVTIEIVCAGVCACVYHQVISQEPLIITISRGKSTRNTFSGVPRATVKSEGRDVKQKP